MSTQPTPHPLVQGMYREHFGWLRGWLWGKVGSRDLAADLAQDTFVRVLAARQAAGVREPRAFLGKIAHDLMINHWRRLAIERAYLEALAARPELLAPSPEARLELLQTLTEIDAMLSRLPARVRQAFLLAQLDGLAYAEIAAQMDVSERMVKKYMAQAMLQCLRCAGPDPLQDAA